MVVTDCDTKLTVDCLSNLPSPYLIADVQVGSPQLAGAELIEGAVFSQVQPLVPNFLQYLSRLDPAMVQRFQAPEQADVFIGLSSCHCFVVLVFVFFCWFCWFTESGHVGLDLNQQYHVLHTVPYRVELLREKFAPESAEAPGCWLVICQP